MRRISEFLETVINSCRNFGINPKYAVLVLVLVGAIGAILFLRKYLSKESTNKDKKI